jgi:hypothetical protein
MKAFKITILRPTAVPVQASQDALDYLQTLASSRCSATGSMALRSGRGPRAAPMEGEAALIRRHHQSTCLPDSAISFENALRGPDLLELDRTPSDRPAHPFGQRGKSLFRNEAVRRRKLIEEVDMTRRVRSFLRRRGLKPACCTGSPILATIDRVGRCVLLAQGRKLRHRSNFDS